MKHDDNLRLVVKIWVNLYLYLNCYFVGVHWLIFINYGLINQYKIYT